MTSAFLADCYFFATSYLQTGKENYAEVLPATAAVIISSFLRGGFINSAIDEYNASVDKRTSSYLLDNDSHTSNIMKLTLLEGKF